MQILLPTFVSTYKFQSVLLFLCISWLLLGLLRWLNFCLLGRSGYQKMWLCFGLQSCHRLETKIPFCCFGKDLLREASISVSSISFFLTFWRIYLGSFVLTSHVHCSLITSWGFLVTRALNEWLSKYSTFLSLFPNFKHKGLHFIEPFKGLRVWNNNVV